MTLGRMAAGEACRTEGLEAEDPVVVEVVVSVVAVVSGGGGAACRSCLVCPRELAGGNHTHTTACFIKQATKEITTSVAIYWWQR